MNIGENTGLGDGRAAAVGQLEDRRFVGAERHRLVGDVEFGQLRAGTLVRGQHRRSHRHVDVLPPACDVAVPQRGEHRDDALQAGVDVSVAAGVATQLAVRAFVVLIEDVGQARLGVHRGREGWPIAPGASLAVAADRHVDHVWVELDHVLVAEAEAREGARTKVLHDHVCRFAHSADDVAPLGEVEVNAEVALAGVLLRIVDRHRTDVRDAAAADIAGGRLDLGHVGPEIAQGLGATRAGQHACEVQHLDAWSGASISARRLSSSRTGLASWSTGPQA
jgi:hypothetical protein